MLDGRVSNQPLVWYKWVEINYESRGGYTTGSDIKFKNTRSTLCDYTRQADERNKGAIFKNLAK